MKNTNPITRREFIESTTVLALAASGAGLLLAACGEDNPSTAGAQPGTGQPQPPSTQPGRCERDGTMASFNPSGDGHTLSVSREDVTAGVPKSYDVRGSATHTHTVTLTAEDFDSLKRDETIQTRTTVTLGHTHLVTVSCA
jgi:hypothetical protein